MNTALTFGCSPPPQPLPREGGGEQAGHYQDKSCLRSAGKDF